MSDEVEELDPDKGGETTMWDDAIKAAEEADMLDTEDTEYAGYGEEDYVPMFSQSERKAAYLVSGVLGIIAGVFVIVGAVSDMPTWVSVVGACVNMVASTISSMFGVRYVSLASE